MGSTDRRRCGCQVPLCVPLSDSSLRELGPTTMQTRWEIHVVPRLVAVADKFDKRTTSRRANQSTMVPELASRPVESLACSGDGAMGERGSSGLNVDMAMLCEEAPTRHVEPQVFTDHLYRCKDHIRFPAGAQRPSVLHLTGRSVRNMDPGSVMQGPDLVEYRARCAD